MSVSVIMLTKKQIADLRERLQEFQNPLFLYDNDADGLCSFLLLRRWLGRGSGVAIRSYPELDESYAKKAAELNSDAIVVLDKPVLSQEFIDYVHSMSLPFVWIDHHDVGLPNIYPDMTVYNPALNEGVNKSNEPVTYICYSITERKEDIWIAIAGCISDHYLPDFHKDFKKKYPELWGKVKKPFDAYFGTEIGNIAMALNFGIKDKTGNIENMQNYLLKCKGPADVLSENEENSQFRQNVSRLKGKFDSLFAEATQDTSGNIIFFEYGGDTSMSTELSNALSHKYPEKYIIVIYRKEGIASVSIRGKNVKSMLSSIIPKIENSTGGGHNDAVGARIPLSKIEDFRNLFREAVSEGF